LNKIYQDLINLDDDGYVVSHDCNTNIDNIFVAGDIRTKSLRQLVTAASDGAIAANLAINYLNKIDI
jgi:thioredoxin reductase (NADPH)